jgi:hypothetical protein
VHGNRKINVLSVADRQFVYLYGKSLRSEIILILVIGGDVDGETIT